MRSNFTVVEGPTASNSDGPRTHKKKQYIDVDSFCGQVGHRIAGGRGAMMVFRLG